MAQVTYRESATASGPWTGAPARTLALAAVFGGSFGFVLQRGGVAKFDILVGALLLENFVVVKLMLSAIVVGMVGVHLLEARGTLERQVGETVYGRSLIGGLVFGVGFGLLAYCPGTDAAAVGQGNLDAWLGVIGMAGGSYVFARWPGIAQHPAVSWGDRGEVTLDRLARMPRAVFVAIAVAVLLAILLLLELAGL